MALNKQSHAFHETLPADGADVVDVDVVYVVLDPAGTGRYMLASRASDGLGEAWIVDDGTGVHHLNDASAGAVTIGYIASANVALL